MLRAAMVFMIVAGIFGLPAVMCSGCMSECGRGMGMDKLDHEGQSLIDFLYMVSLIASFGSIIMGALVTKLKKITSGSACFIFAICFAFLLVQGNFFGLFSSILLVIAGVMIFVAPSEQFVSAPSKSGTNVEVVENKITTGYKFCTECGSKIEVNSKFCTSCGEQIE
jgi:hypothetical protein